MKYDTDNINSHKLTYHPDRVSEWLKGGGYPINAEISISGACNHRCYFCSVDYMNYIPKFLSKELLDIRMREMKQKGLKSVLLAGSGEPLIHKDAVEIINNLKRIGLDVALSTNGVLFTKDKAELCMESLSWIRFSVSAGKEETYKKIHRGKDGDLERLFRNIEDAAKIKKEKKYNTILNVQIVVTPDNIQETVMLAKKVKELGADRFIAKSLGWLPKTESTLRDTVNREEFYANQEDLKAQLLMLNDKDFECVYRTDRVNKIIHKRKYKECYGSSFHVCIDSDGEVVPCCTFMGESEMSYGNLKQQTFDEIWQGKNRQEVLNKLKEAELAICPLECKLDNMNNYLFELVNPGEHVNFI